MGDASEGFEKGERMKILHVITSLLTGGAEKLIVDIVPRLREKGHVVDVVLFNGVDSPLLQELQKHEGVTVYCLGKSFYDIRYIFKLRQIIKNYDIIHTHNSSSQLYTVLANTGLHNKLITTEHNTTNRKRNNFLLRLVDRWMYKQYEQIICISDKAAEKLKDYLGYSDRICVIYNGVDVERFHQAQPIAGMKSSSFVALMVAAFRPQKDQDTLVRAISRLPKEKYEVWFAGEGVRLAVVQNLVKKLEVDNQVRFLMNRTDVPKLLKTADVIVMSTHYEGLSLSNIEGMSAGKPFIASDVDGVREITKGYGILFPHEDDKALAEIILRLTQDKKFYNEIASRCYERANEYDIEKTVKGYLHVYEDLLS